jgi:hypothetical protein
LIRRWKFFLAEFLKGRFYELDLNYGQGVVKFFFIFFSVLEFAEFMAVEGEVNHHNLQLLGAFLMSFLDGIRKVLGIGIQLFIEWT